MQGQLRSLENPPPRVRRTWRTISLVAHPSQPQNPSGAGARGSHDTHRRSGYGLQTKYTLYLTAVPSANRLPAWARRGLKRRPRPNRLQRREALIQES